MNQFEVPFRLGPRASRREHDSWNQAMLSELEDMIDQQNCDAVNAANNEFDLLYWAKACARADIPELLQQLYPEIAEFITSPKRARGRKRLKIGSASVAETGADYAARIRAHWKQKHGRMKRRNTETSAEDFAVMILRKWYFPPVSVDEILAAAKRAGKRKVRQG